MSQPVRMGQFTLFLSKLHAILNYVQDRTILADLSQAGITAEEKAMVCWEVNGLGKNSTDLAGQTRRL